ncbi:helix-turn-helix domain-containing protein [Poseidonocella sp. HB161398]|uniref:helix-turn-helix domain-containing protein n=1 Tax=Poseidonocella sp. HB161398 TaxID=2320855 RepID=UPI001108EBAD|nr:helix-turn-helix domain-containing protein [Poseidonocella sp. HB161398]
MTAPASPADGGFVRMPRTWLTLAISPQAKTLLLAFCGFADAKGESWHSYEELGRLLNRSKSSISAYVAELREHGLIDCIRQTYGNGYNYRLRIVVLGWAEMCGRWAEMSREAAKRAVPKAERRVQDAERKDPKGPKNQIPQNKTPAPALPAWTAQLEAQWREHRPSDADPVSVWHGQASADFLGKVIACAEGAKTGLWSHDEAKRGARSAVSAFALRHGLSASAKDVEEAAALVAGTALHPDALDSAIRALDAVWKPHWKHLPRPGQLQATISDPVRAAMPDPEILKRIGLLRNRAWIARQQLAKLAPAGPVPAGTGPQCSGTASIAA